MCCDCVKFPVEALVHVTSKGTASSLIKGAVKAEAATASVSSAPRAPSRTSPLQSPVDVIHKNESVRPKAEATESAIPRKHFVCVSSKASSRLKCVSIGSSSSLLPSTKPTARRVSRRRSSHVRVKTEAVASTIPRKRLSDVALLSEDRAIESLAISKENPLKKAKTEVTTKIPLGQVTNTSVASASSGPAAMYPPFPIDPFNDPFNDPYVKLQNIQIEMAIQENALDELRRKWSLSAEDHWSIVNCQNELQRLRDLELETNFYLMDPRPLPENRSIVKKEPVVDEVENMANLVNRRYSSPFARNPHVPQAFPMAMDVDNESFIEPFSPSALERQSFVTRPKQPVASGSNGSSPPFPKYEPYLPRDNLDMNSRAVDEVEKLANIVNRRYSSPLTDRKPNVPQAFPMAMEVDRKPFIKPEPPAAPSLSFPASSSIPATNPSQHFSPPPFERKPFVTPPKQPVASGSKGPSPSFPKYESDLQSDDFGMNPSDSESEDYVNPAIAHDLVNRIGINIPPPIENDAQDDNGDYYGRGRDLFEGPRANADEYVYAPYFNTAMDFLTILP